ncbi:MAG: macro domain-containing protein [Candidatus Thorarchaeota archaeon]|jgi:O-acetyl-ADP-ribose deacetylase (regulator of RNase III)
MRIHLRDRNQELVDWWNHYFAKHEDVTATCGDIFADGEHMDVDAIVSPANSFGFMDGGIDYVYSEFFGWGMSEDLRSTIYFRHEGELLVGQAEVVDIRDTNPDTPINFLISAPTMRTPLDVSKSVNAFLAFRAALKIAEECEFNSILCPGLATAIGCMPFKNCAFQMYEAWIQRDTRRTFDQLGVAHLHAIQMMNPREM